MPVELIIKKSKFIGYYQHINEIKEVENFLLSLKLEHKKATHFCYAYICEGQEKFCDDGEPNGTAGRPILNVMKKQNLNNILIVIVRYFGGIKLGAGGLTRAYVNTTAEVAKTISGLKK